MEGTNVSKRSRFMKHLFKLKKTIINRFSDNINNALEWAYA